MRAGRSYAKVVRAQAEERTRTALLDAADEAFLSGPWSRASLDGIAGAAGVTKQTLLRHFGSKEGLLEQAIRRGRETVLEQRFSAPTDDIHGAVDNLLDHYEMVGGKAMRSSNFETEGTLAELGRAARELHYAWVDHAFGTWLSAASPRERGRLRSALIAICDVQVWWILSHDLELVRSEVRATLILTISRLLGEPQ